MFPAGEEAARSGGDIGDGTKQYIRENPEGFTTFTQFTKITAIIKLKEV